MSDYPTLDEMGIQNPQEIARYTLHTHDNTDHLRIIYERKPGSFLPVTRRYQFGRSSKNVVTDSGTSTHETVYEISPVLVRALKELDQAVESNKHPQASTKEDILKEIDRLENDFQSHVQSLRDMAEKL